GVRSTPSSAWATLDRPRPNPTARAAATVGLRAVRKRLLSCKTLTAFLPEVAGHPRWLTADRTLPSLYDVVKTLSTTLLSASASPAAGADAPTRQFADLIRCRSASTRSTGCSWPADVAPTWAGAVTLRPSSTRPLGGSRREPPPR